MTQYIWTILTTMDSFLCALLGLYFLKLHARYGKYIAMVFIGLALESVGTRILFFTYYTGASNPNLLLFFIRVLLRLCKVIPEALLLLYLFNFISKGEENAK